MQAEGVLKKLGLFNLQLMMGSPSGRTEAQLSFERPRTVQILSWKMILSGLHAAEGSVHVKCPVLLQRSWQLHRELWTFLKQTKQLGCPEAFVPRLSSAGSNLSVFCGTGWCTVNTACVQQKQLSCHSEHKAVLCKHHIVL